MFYNGRRECPVESTMKLSDAFIENCDKIAIEAVVKVINVRYEKGAELLKKCQDMAEYSRFVQITEAAFHKIGNREEAMEDAVRTCLNEGILKEFLNRYGGDVVSFLFESLTAEECMQIREEDAIREGLEKGIEQGIKQGASKEKERVAKALRAEGVADEIIAKCTGLSIQQIQKL